MMHYSIHKLYLHAEVWGCYRHPLPLTQSHDSDFPCALRNAKKHKKNVFFFFTLANGMMGKLPKSVPEHNCDCMGPPSPEHRIQCRFRNKPAVRRWSSGSELQAVSVGLGSSGARTAGSSVRGFSTAVQTNSPDWGREEIMLG